MIKFTLTHIEKDYTFEILRRDNFHDFHDFWMEFVKDGEVDFVVIYDANTKAHTISKDILKKSYVTYEEYKH